MIDVAVGEDADDVGAAADLPVEPFVGVVGPDLAPDLLGEGGEREDVGAGVVEVVGDGGQLVGQGVEDPVELGVHRRRRRAGRRRECSSALTHGQERLRGDGHQVRGVVGAAPLPRRAGQGRADRLDQAGVGVGGDQRDPGQAAGDQVAEERQPAGAGLGAVDLHARGSRGARRR